MLSTELPEHTDHGNVLGARLRVSRVEAAFLNAIFGGIGETSRIPAAKGANHSTGSGSHGPFIGEI